MEPNVDETSLKLNGKVDAEEHFVIGHGLTRVVTPPNQAKRPEIE